MRAGVVVFPGSNCDRDMENALRLLGAEVTRCWHAEPLPPALDLVTIPGGFSYGDYLRCGALAAITPVLRSVREFAASGGLVLGVCNGFQILCEAGLLPGVLRRNAGLRFRCRNVTLRVERQDTAFTSRCDRVLQLPIAHGEGRYFADAQTIHQLEGEGRVLFRYAESDGEATDEANPNGSLNNIAGITNACGNVLGMMPHPERAVERITGGTDGAGLFLSLRGVIQGVSA